MEVRKYVQLAFSFVFLFLTCVALINIEDSSLLLVPAYTLASAILLPFVSIAAILHYNNPRNTNLEYDPFKRKFGLGALIWNFVSIFIFFLNIHKFPFSLTYSLFALLYIVIFNFALLSFTFLFIVGFL